MKPTSGKDAFPGAGAGAVVVRMPGGNYGSLHVEKLADTHRLLMNVADGLETLPLVIDLSDVHSFGASFISVLLETRNRLRETGRKLAVCGLNPHAVELFRILRLDELFDIDHATGRLT